LEASGLGTSGLGAIGLGTAPRELLKNLIKKAKSKKFS
jgi:hypothetical protein